MPLTVEDGVVHGEEPSNRLSKEEGLKNYLSVLQRSKNTYETMKEEAKAKGKSPGRIGALNQHIENCNRLIDETLRELEEIEQ
jgi:hypothetical protein